MITLRYGIWDQINKAILPFNSPRVQCTTRITTSDNKVVLKVLCVLREPKEVHLTSSWTLENCVTSIVYTMPEWSRSRSWLNGFFSPFEVELLCAARWKNFRKKCYRLFFGPTISAEYADTEMYTRYEYVLRAISRIMHVHLVDLFYSKIRFGAKKFNVKSNVANASSLRWRKPWSAIRDTAAVSPHFQLGSSNIRVVISWKQSLLHVYVFLVGEPFQSFSYEERKVSIVKRFQCSEKKEKWFEKSGWLSAIPSRWRRSNCSTHLNICSYT